MKKNKKLISYNDLAWTELIVTSPKECKKETELFCNTIKNNSKIKPKTLLHLGCGAGIYDHNFKKHFKVTGVDISNGMLKIAKKLNPKINYIKGDMRNVKINAKFDAVVIPDSIGYITTLKDLRKTINTAYSHLNIGGILLIVAHIRDNFNENNFVYTGKLKGVEITIFENNYIINKTNYEATIVYLIRRKGKLEIYTDRHKLGLFNSKEWLALLKRKHFSIKKTNLDHMYDRFMPENGKYPQIMFACRKIK
jgi:ubiquinone/menaquinone biosynthesis C-methylase UbiE